MPSPRRIGSLGILRSLSALAFIAAIAVAGGCGSSTTGSSSTGSGGTGGSGSTATPTLSAAVAPQGNISPGQTGAVYSVTVSNTGTAATSGTVTVTDPPSNFTITAVSGTGWTCSLSGTPPGFTCTTSTALAASASYPPILVTGTVTGGAGQSVSIPITVSGGGATSSASSTPTITIVAPLTISDAFNQATIAAGATSALTITIANPSANTVSQSSVAFTDTLPTGLVVATPNALANTCGGTATATAGSGTISLTGGTVATSGNCTVTASVTTTKSGSYPDATGTIASSNGGTGTSNTATLTVNPGAAAKVVFTGEPSNATAGSSIAPAVTATIEDSFGNVVSSATSLVNVAISTNPGSATLNGTTSASAVSGVATFSNLSINKAANGYVLSAAVTGLPSTTSNAFNVSAGTAAQLVFTTQPPASTSAGASLASAVTIEDALGNVETSATSQVSIAIGANPGNATLNGTTSVSAVSGVATFSGLSIDTSGNGYTLTASASGVTSATSNVLNVQAGSAAKLAFVSQPANTEEGTNFSVTLGIEDAFGNIVTGATNSITVALGVGDSGLLLGTGTQPAVNGYATFSGLSISSVGTGDTLTASATSLNGATSNSFNVAGAPTQLVFSIEPQNAQTNNPIAPAVQVTIEDAAGNVVTTASNTITVAIQTNPGSATLSGATMVSAQNGVAVFSNLSLNDAANGYTLVASATLSNNLESTISSAFNVANEGPQITSANAITFTTDNTNSFTITTSGDPAPTISDNSATLPSGVTFTNNGNGTATLSSTATLSAAGAYPVTLTANNGIGTQATQNFTLTVAAGNPDLQITVSAPGAFASEAPFSIAIKVTNDAAGDSLSATETTGGVACSPATCGTFGAITGSISGMTGTYTLPYTPPASVAAQTTIALTVSSSLANSFAATANLSLYPQGQTVVTVNSPGNNLAPGAEAVVNAFVYNDTTGMGAQLALLGSGYACPSNGSGGTICGTLPTPTNTTGTTAQGVPYTKSSVMYTAPSSGPILNPPYSNPMILASSVGDPAAFADATFSVGSNAISGFPDVALTGYPFTVSDTFSNDGGLSKTINWALLANSSTCAPICGSLGGQTYTRNGETVATAITYTPPQNVPTGADQQPTGLATEVDNPAASTSFTFNIQSGACGTGSTNNNGALNGQYAFVLPGAGVGQGYVAQIGSFTADGNGNILGGLVDVNRTTGASLGLSITSGTYVVGTDNRGCLTIVFNTGTSAVYRIALGTVNGSGVATQGQMLRFDDYTGESVRQEGELLLQTPGPFSAGQFSGTYVFGFTGVGFDGISLGARLVGAGLMTSDGVSSLSSVTEDVDTDTGASGEMTGGSGGYLLTSTANGRGTGSYSVPTLGTNDFVFYIVSSSKILFMTSDPLTEGTPIVDGEMDLQTGGPFTTSMLNTSNYAFYFNGIDPNNNGVNTTTLGQVTTTTGGAATVTLDENDGGIEQAEGTQSITLTMGANGRATLTASGNPPIFYFINPSTAFMVATDDGTEFGLMQQQSAGPDNNATVSGTYFYGGNAPSTASNFDIGTANIDGSGELAGAGDTAGPPQNGGLQPNQLVGGSYCFSATCGAAVTAFGQGNVGSGTLAYIISPSQVIFMETGSDPESFVVQH